jgi:hypothetical protein
MIFRYFLCSSYPGNIRDSTGGNAHHPGITDAKSMKI